MLRLYTNPMKIFGIRQQVDTHIEVDLDEEWIIPAAPPFSKVNLLSLIKRQLTDYLTCFLCRHNGHHLKECR